MEFIPLNKMWSRVEIARENNYSELYRSLTLTGEMFTKVITSGLIAGIKDEREEHRYRQTYKLVRASSLGSWAEAISEITQGQTSQFVHNNLRREITELTQKNKNDTWQYEAISLVYECLNLVFPQPEKLATKVSANLWFHLFAELRNKTRGHGAESAEDHRRMCKQLEKSLLLMIENLSLLKRPWVYLQEQLSGTYRITSWTESGKYTQLFKDLREQRPKNPILEGTYIYFDDEEIIAPENLSLVELVKSDIELRDLYLPNGGWNDNKYELISYITNDREHALCNPYLRPITNLPSSETEGLIQIQPKGESFVNLPQKLDGYVPRKELEANLKDELLARDYHRIITLSGRGGIGKTSLALTVLHEIAATDRYTAILWFSARDIDLIESGSKPVKAHILTISDVAKEFKKLIDEYYKIGANEQDEMNRFLSSSEIIGPILFIFDNFETVQSPNEFYEWLDIYIRPKNKVLITTRHSEFNGDNQVAVGGMAKKECDELIQITASKLGITHLIDKAYSQQIYEESDGHPYVIKILLGEVSKTKKIDKVERIVANKSKILEALFERTYQRLSLSAKRVFLTLCGWRSAVLEIAIQAVLLRPDISDKIDVEEAINEVVQSSLVERIGDNNEFLSVPLVASVFGRGKLDVSHMKPSIQADLELLHLFGTTQHSDISQGKKPRVERLFRAVAQRVRQNPQELKRFVPILEFVATEYRPGWLLLAELYTEFHLWDEVEYTLKRVLEGTNDENLRRDIWAELLDFYYRTKDFLREIQARVELCKLPDTEFDEISATANRINSMFKNEYIGIESDSEKQILVYELIKVMEKRITEGDATDCSRLGWLYINLGNKDKAVYIAQQGLQKEPDNYHCDNLIRKFIRN